jgi:hypothetical protein
MRSDGDWVGGLSVIQPRFGVAGEETLRHGVDIETTESGRGCCMRVCDSERPAWLSQSNMCLRVTKT